MKETLDRVVTNEYLAWNNTLSEKKEKFIVDLNPEIIEELIKKKNLLLN